MDMLYRLVNASAGYGRIGAGHELLEEVGLYDLDESPLTDAVRVVRQLVYLPVLAALTPHEYDVFRGVIGFVEQHVAESREVFLLMLRYLLDLRIP